MANRIFNVTVPSSGYHNVYSLIVGVVSLTNPHGYGAAQGGTDETGLAGAIPTDGILPDRGNSITMIDPSSGGSTITVSDRNFANSPGVALAAGQTYADASNKNSICFKDYLVSGSGPMQVKLSWT